MDWLIDWLNIHLFIIYFTYCYCVFQYCRSFPLADNTIPHTSVYDQSSFWRHFLFFCYGPSWSVKIQICHFLCHIQTLMNIQNVSQILMIVSFQVLVLLVLAAVLAAERRYHTRYNKWKKLHTATCLNGRLQLVWNNYFHVIFILCTITKALEGIMDNLMNVMYWY